MIARTVMQDAVMVRSLLFDPTTGQDFVAQWQRLDWQLLQNSSVHRYSDDTALDRTCAGLADLGYLVHRFDTSDWTDAAALHTALAATLDFPSYYGRNLDALNDVLGDIAEYRYGADPNATGTVLAFAGYEVFAQRDPDHAQALLDIFAGKARHGLLVGHPMLCLISTERDFLPVGATPVMHSLPPSSQSIAGSNIPT